MTSFQSIADFSQNFSHKLKTETGEKWAQIGVFSSKENQGCDRRGAGIEAFLGSIKPPI